MEMVEVPVWVFNSLSLLAGVGLVLGPVNFYVCMKKCRRNL